MKKWIVLVVGIVSGYMCMAQEFEMKSVEATSSAKSLVINAKGSDITCPDVFITSPYENQVFTLPFEQAKGLQPVLAVSFSGTATDGSGIAEVKVNTVTASVNANTGAFTAELRLPVGKHTVKIWAKDKNGNTSEKLVNMEVIKGAPDNPVVTESLKKNLYVLSIGVSTFPNRGSYFNNLSYPDEDAKAVQELFQSMEGVLYNNVETKLLVNEQATKRNIIGALTWIEKTPANGDVVVIFISTHGFNDDDYAYIMPSDGDYKDLRFSAVDFDDINRTVTKLSDRNQRNCKVLMLIDACHSGQFISQTAKGTASKLDVDKALTDINKPGYGVLMLHSSEPHESSYEDAQWKHGAFTFALLKSLKEGEGDTDNNGVIYFDELATYVCRKVPEITKKFGAQHPQPRNPGTVKEFPVTVIK